MKRVLLSLGLTMALVGCGGGGHPVACRPLIFGGGGHCYYAQSPAEVVALQQAGLCDPTWTPLLMSPAWHAAYWPYYSSPAYYSLYVPRAQRSSYAGLERSWGSTNQTAIAESSKSAQYKGSNGKVVPAEKIGATKYGGGNRFGPVGTKFGGGARDATPGTPGGSKQPPAKATPDAPDSPSKAPTPSKAPSAPSKAPSSPSAPKSSPGGSKSFGGGSRTGGGSSGHIGGSGGGSHSFGGGHR
jgi:hypothetical protein